MPELRPADRAPIQPWRREGLIRLSKGLYAIVDERDVDFLVQWSWCASHESRGTKWYAIRFERKRNQRLKVRMHRAIWERYKGPVPKGMVIDHLNHNSLDCRFHNLEAVTQTENMKRSPGWKKKASRSLKSEAIE